MKRFEIFHEKGRAGIRVFSPTKAGLAVTAVKGLFAAANVAVEEGTDARREFDLHAVDFTALLQKLLDAAIEQAKAHGESYSDVYFELITDKKAIGAFSGGKARGPLAMPRIDSMSEMKKNDDGEWETVIAFA